MAHDSLYSGACCIQLLKLALIAITNVAAVPAQDRNVLSPNNYCGLYAVYGAAVYEGLPIEFRSLLNTAYLGCTRGSSMAELQRAAEDHGLRSLVMARMTPNMLRSGTTPVVLYVRSGPGAANFDHYILYLRYRNGKYECMDGDELRHLTTSELMTLWSGAGMALSASEMTMMRTLLPTWLTRCLWLAVTIALVIAGKRLESRWSKWRKGSAIQEHLISIAVLLGASMLAALVYHRSSDGGMLINADQIQTIQAAYAGASYTEGSVP